MPAADTPAKITPHTLLMLSRGRDHEKGFGLGNRAYSAQAKAAALPQHPFSERPCHACICMQADSLQQHVKDLGVVLGAEAAAIIVDDTAAVWPQHAANLLLARPCRRLPGVLCCARCWRA